jgi:uncharacterized protein YdhG (YjbR/CyaY superfamily)
MQPGKGFTSVDEYIATFPPETQALLTKMRETIQAEAPDATERIAYQMPTFYQHGNVVHFAALKHHIGFYPTSSGVAAFERELSSYISTKGAVRFPMDQPLPLDLIRRITRFRVRENQERAAAKAGKKRTQ